MAPRVSAKGNARVQEQSAGFDAKRMLQAIAAAQAEALKSSRWVGRRFAEEARAMHEGTQEQAVIHGQATVDEARSLAEDGIAATPLLVPVVPPKALN